MLSYLEGSIIASTQQYIIVLVSGLGYKVFTTPSFIGKPIGTPVKMFLYHKTSDDGQWLFGMETFEELQLFELLLTVSGVGPKSALGIISTYKPDQIMSAISKGDTALFTSISGLGKKSAERIILELKNKVGTLPGLEHSGDHGSVIDALLSLGYQKYELSSVVSQLDHGSSTENQIKQALKLLSKK